MDMLLHSYHTKTGVHHEAGDAEILKATQDVRDHREIAAMRKNAFPSVIY
jgi:hypothetical protein